MLYEKLIHIEGAYLTCTLGSVDNVDDRGYGRVLDGCIGGNPLLAMTIATLADDDRRLVDKPSSVWIVGCVEEFAVLLSFNVYATARLQTSGNTCARRGG